MTSQRVHMSLVLGTTLVRIARASMRWGSSCSASAAQLQRLSLPRTGWENWQKVTVSKASASTNLGRESPSCAYHVPSTMDIQARIDDGSFQGFGSSNRPDLSLSLGVDPHGSPGPTYNVRECPAMQVGTGPIAKSRENKSARSGSVNRGAGALVLVSIAERTSRCGLTTAGPLELEDKPGKRW